MKLKNSKGFSVIESMIAALLASIIILGVYNFYLNQQNFSIGQAKKAQLQRNLRLSMDIIIQGIRRTGYDPEGSGSFGISPESTAAEIRYTLDENNDGLLGAGEEHRFRLDGTTLQYTKDANVGEPGGSFTWHSVNVDPIEISALEFTYLDVDDPVDGVVDMVGISITGQIKMPLGSGVYETQTLNSKTGLRN
ncbi:MAG: hypothetical protein KAJ66_06880 [Candidatus Omnitrophica bacterium]|nr:hypothetical protein [Candidatus Omnitrophota bacterium]